MSRPFNIRIFMVEGLPDGLRHVEKSNWVGLGIVCPRNRYPHVKKRAEFEASGVYILVGGAGDDDRPTLYIGEADRVRDRLDGHHAKKDFWQQAIVFTTKGDPLNKAEVQYLEARLVEKARAAKRCKLDNGNFPQRPGLSESDEAEIEGYLEEMLPLLPVLGIHAFEQLRTPSPDLRIYFSRGSGLGRQGLRGRERLRRHGWEPGSRAAGPVDAGARPKRLPSTSESDRRRCARARRRRLPVHRGHRFRLAVSSGDRVRGQELEWPNELEGCGRRHPEGTPGAGGAGMIDDLKSYPTMKDSGVPWLGKVPAHWEVRPVRYLAALTGRTGTTSADTTDTDTGVLNATPSELNGRMRGTRTRKFLERARHQSFDIAPAGSTAICTIASVGQASRFVRRFATNPQVRALVPRETQVAGEFLFLLTLLLKPELQRIASTSVVPFVNGSDVTGLRVVAPSLPEQAAIVRFIDLMDRRIRRYIRAKQKLIRLLEEQRKAMIHRAVTRGLDPNVRLKASGVEWLGAIPGHWVIARAGSVCEFISAKAHEQFVEPDGEHICVTARFVSTDGRSFRRCTRNLSPAQRGDVLMVMSDLPRGRALARAYYVNDDRSYAVNQRVCILRAKRAHSRFIAFSVDRHPELMAHDDGFNQTHLPNAAFKTMRVPLPPREEQAAIADFLDRATRAIDTSAAHAAREIDLLREFRTRLIADVVTGKLDVREAALSLPEVHDEPESTDDTTSLANAEDGIADDLEAVTEEVEA